MDYEAVANALLVDAVTAEVVGQFDRQGVPVVLLKGPVTVALVYSDGAPRGYGDTDLLIRRCDEEDAERLLAGLGFAADAGFGAPDPGVARNHIWRRGEAVVELHVNISGVHAPSERLWDAFTAGGRSLMVGGQPARIPAPAAQVLQLALHACQHGRDGQQPKEDLCRGVAQLPVDLWREAADLAVSLDAIAAFTLGVNLVSGGAGLLNRLGHHTTASVQAALAADSAPSIARGLQRVAEVPGVRAKFMRLVRAAFPRPAFMRWWSPLARRGAVGLALAYLWRPVWAVLGLPRGVAAWRRARRLSRER